MFSKKKLKVKVRICLVSRFNSPLTSNPIRINLGNIVYKQNIFRF